MTHAERAERFLTMVFANGEWTRRISWNDIKSGLLAEFGAGAKEAAERMRERCAEVASRHRGSCQTVVDDIRALAVESEKEAT